MLGKVLHFIKYNNGAVIILALILLLGGGALAAGPEAVGQKQTTVEGLDNAALLTADLTNFKMDFKIEKIEQDEKYYYVSYSFLDLVLTDQAWQYQLSQKTQKVSKKIKDDLGLYLAKFLAKHYEARLRGLKQEKSRAQSQGEQKRIEVTEYSGLIGRTLDAAAKIFPGYEPVKKVELPTPDFTNLLNPPLQGGQETPLQRGGEGGLNSPAASGVDGLTRIYNDYVAAHPEVFAPLAAQTVGVDASSTPPTPLSRQDGGQAGGEAPTPSSNETPSSVETPALPTSAGLPQPESVEVIELPATSPTPFAEPAPAPAVEPAPQPAATPEIAPEATPAE